MYLRILCRLSLATPFANSLISICHDDDDDESVSLSAIGLAIIALRPYFLQQGTDGLSSQPYILSFGCPSVRSIVRSFGSPAMFIRMKLMDTQNATNRVNLLIYMRKINSLM